MCSEYEGRLYMLWAKKFMGAGSVTRLVAYALEGGQMEVRGERDGQCK